MAVQNKALKLPHTFALMFVLTAVMATLTWIIPAGVYDVDPQTKRVIADSYHQVASNPQGLWDIFNAVTKGMIQSAVMMSMVFFIGGAVEVIEQTGTIRAGMGRIVGMLKGKEIWAVVVIMIAMSIGGAVGVFANPVIALIPVGVLLAKSLGYDAVVGFAMMYLASYAGFNVGWANMFTVGIANEIAGLPITSGFGIRVVLHVLNIALTIAFVLIYIRRIKKDPAKSLVYDPNAPAQAEDAGVLAANAKMTWRQSVCALIVVLSFGFIIYGSLNWKWGISHYSTVFLIMGLTSGFIGGLGLNQTFKAFTKGMSGLTYAAFVIVFARAISVVMTDGKIIHTIVYYLSMPIGKVSAVAGANLMFLANVIINFFIPSGSGQAVTVMPIMVPVADLSNISRQVAVQAFQFGDGFTNCFIPTSGVLMGVLGLAGIAYGKYVRWFLPMLLVQLLMGSITVTLMQIFGW